MKRSAAVFFLLLLASEPVLAQSSLGFRTGDVSASVLNHAPSGGAALTSEAAGLRADFAITGHHGLQLDLGYADAGSGRIGTLAGHLYMTPQRGQKYGLFFSYGDFDGISASVTQLGTEGIFALSNTLSLEARAGIGVRDPNSLDYVFAGLGLSRNIGTSGHLSAEFDFADFDEAGFSTTMLDARVTYAHQLRGTPATLSLTLGAVGLDGDGSPQGGAYIGVGLHFRLGRGDAGSGTGMFGRAEPITTLHRVGVF